jgi:hypothetical protein
MSPSDLLAQRKRQVAISWFVKKSKILYYNMNHEPNVVLTVLCFSYNGVILVFFNFLGWGETVHLVRRPLSGLLYQARMIAQCVVVGGMRIGRGNRSSQRGIQCQLVHHKSHMT